MSHPTDLSRVQQCVHEIVGKPYARDLVAAYFDPAHGFAGALFDGLDSDNLLGVNPPGRFTTDDIVAVSLLDVRFGPTAVRELLTCSAIQAALAAIPENVPLWEVEDADFAAAEKLWALLRAINGVGRTRASKLLARKRPHLVPIVDSVIAKAWCLQGDTWRPLAATLSDSDLRQDIDALRPASVSIQVSTLRLLDVLTWMSHSRSKTAVLVQEQLGAPTMRVIPARRAR